MQTKFYVNHESQRLGPFSREDIQHKLKTTELFPTDYVYVEDQEDWVMLIDFIDEKEITDDFPLEKTDPSIDVPVISEEEEESDDPTLQEAKSVVSLENGVGEFRLIPNLAEKIHLQLQPHQALKVSDPTQVDIEPSSVGGIQIKAPEYATAGETVTLEVKAIDSVGNRASSFFGRGTIEFSSDSQSLQFENGVAHIQHQQTLAGVETIKATINSAEFSYSCESQIDWQAAPATQLIVEKPPAVQEGQEALITIKAVDPYGNVDTNFTGQVDLVFEDSTKSPLEIKDGILTRKNAG